MFCVDVSLPQCTTPASRPRNVGKRKAQLVVAEALVLVAGCPSSDSEWEVPGAPPLPEDRGQALFQGCLPFPQLACSDKNSPSDGTASLLSRSFL